MTAPKLSKKKSASNRDLLKTQSSGSSSPHIRAIKQANAQKAGATMSGYLHHSSSILQMLNTRAIQSSSGAPRTLTKTNSITNATKDHVF